MKPSILVLIAIAALGIAMNNPENKAEGNSLMASVTDTIDPYLQNGFSEDTHQELKSQSREAADFMTEAGAEFGVELTFGPGK